MANIQVKGINDYLLFIVNDEVDEAICLDELHGLLSSPSFQKKNFYVKGYFDLGKRQLTKELFEQLLHILNQTRNVLFCGTQSGKNCKSLVPFLFIFGRKIRYKNKGS